MAIPQDNNNTNITKTPLRHTIVQTVIMRDSNSCPLKLVLGPLLNSNRSKVLHSNNNSNSSNSRLSCLRTQAAQLAPATECYLTFIQVLTPPKKESLPLRSKQVRRRLFSLQVVEVRVLTTRVLYIRALFRVFSLPLLILQTIIANVRPIIISNSQMYIV